MERKKNEARDKLRTIKIQLQQIYALKAGMDKLVDPANNSIRMATQDSKGAAQIDWSGVGVRQGGAGPISIGESHTADLREKYVEFTEAIDAFNEQVNQSFNTDIIKLQNSDRLKKY